MKFLVLTKDNDLSSSYLIRWLIFYSIPFTRINLNYPIDEIKIIMKSNLMVELMINNKKINLQGYSHIIYRRGRFNFTRFSLKQFKMQINDILNDEQNILSDFLFDLFEKEKIFGSYFNEKYINKLIVLKEAMKVGLDIPKTIITTNKKTVLSYLSNFNLITKPIFNNFILQYGNKLSSSYTEKVECENMELCEDYFFPTEFQHLIDNQYEIRTFFYKDNYFSTAIIKHFRNVDIDYRTYKDNIRYVPYKLPRLIQNKLMRLMKNIELETGSIDLIKGNDGKYYFLEVNPSGQFSALSYYCNHNIEKKIIDILCQS